MIFNNIRNGISALISSLSKIYNNTYYRNKNTSGYVNEYRYEIISNMIKADLETKKILSKNKNLLLDYYCKKYPISNSLEFFALVISSGYSKYTNKYPNITKIVSELTINLLKFGDCVIVKKTNELIPNISLSIVDDESLIGKQNINRTITSAEYYIHDEFSKDRVVYTKDEVYHISIPSKSSNFELDIYNRPTYGIYSNSPCKSIVKKMEYKDYLELIDIVMRESIIPKRLWIVQRPTTAQVIMNKDDIETAMMNKLNSVSSVLNNLGIGENPVFFDDVSAVNLEHKINYMDINPTLNEIEETIISAIGVPISAIKGKSSSNYASEVTISSYFLKRANAIINVLNNYLSTLYDDDFGDVCIDMEAWKLDEIKRAALASKMNVFTINEIREMMHYKPLTEEQIEELKNNTSSDIDGRTLNGIESSSTTDLNIRQPTTVSVKNKELEDRSLEV